LALKFDKSYPKDFTLIDHNRTGLGLMEIVTEPDFENAFDSYSFVRELALTLKSIGTCTANMSNGEFRVDVNVSCHYRDSATGILGQGVRVELKNLNSFSAVLKATEIEIKRQKTLITSGQAILRQTRTYDSAEHKTVATRTKEDQYDYRFMPEPNLLPLVVYPSQSFNPIVSSYKLFNNQEYGDIELDFIRVLPFKTDKVSRWLQFQLIC
jgi:aspartyl-tRNA(Asn)/glutamyl-tRNA(Gln) amidotransferase subunit B